MSEPLAPYKLEAAKSGRSKCKTCRRKIPKDAVRFGVLIEGPFGPGYLWHHLKCAARKRFDEVQEAWGLGLHEGLKVPTLEKLRKVAEAKPKPAAEKRDAPWAEIAPSDRSKCQHCGEGIAKGAGRVVVLRRVEFGSQIRAAPIKVHPRCVADFLGGDDSILEAEGFLETLRANSARLDESDLEKILSAIGVLEG